MEELLGVFCTWRAYGKSLKLGVWKIFKRMPLGDLLYTEAHLNVFYTHTTFGRISRNRSACGGLSYLDVLYGGHLSPEKNTLWFYKLRKTSENLLLFVYARKTLYG